METILLSGAEILIICYLLFIQHVYRKTLKSITFCLEKNIEGELGERLLYKGCSTKLTKETVKKLNHFLDDYCREIEHLNKLKMTERRTLSNLSHDIKTPLTSLRGFVEVLQSGGNLTEQEKSEYLRIISLKTAHLYHLIQQFFEFSRIEAEDYSTQLTSLDLCSEVRNFLVLYYNDFKIHNIVPCIDMPEVPVMVTANGKCLSRILENLVSNVIKHGASGGKIGVSVRADGQYALLEITDCGKGIPADKLKYIFDRLYTGEESGMKKTGSSGLGLTICRLLVDKMGGRIHIDSTEGKGTSVKISLKSSNQEEINNIPAVKK